MESYYSREELECIGFGALGREIFISRRAAIYSPENIFVGDKVRIDDFCYLSGGNGIRIGDYVHIATYSALYGRFGIRIGNYVNISSRVNIYSTSDDYSGRYLTGPMVDQSLIHDIGAEVVLEDHVIIGAGCVILPGVTLYEGAAVGALSLVKQDIPTYQMFAGIPAVFRKRRENTMLELLEERPRGGDKITNRVLYCVWKGLIACA